MGFINLLLDGFGDFAGEYSNSLGLRVHADGSLDCDSHSQNSWTEYHTPVAYIYNAKATNGGWREHLEMSQNEIKFCDILGLYAIWDNSDLREALSKIDETFIDKKYCEALAKHYKAEEFTLQDYYETDLMDSIITNMDGLESDIFKYCYNNDVVKVPVFEKLEKTHTKRLLASGQSRYNSFPEYKWSMYAIYDEHDDFLGIYSDEV